MSSEAMLELTTKAESIDPAAIGLQSGPYVTVTDVDTRAVEQQVRILTAAQALLQVINTTPAGLVLRDPYVQYDFLDGAGTVITASDWRQPWYNATTAYFSTTTGAIADAVSVYTTGFNSKYTMKIITFWGFELAGVGNERPHSSIVSNGVMFKRGNVKLIDIIDTQGIDIRDPPRLVLRTPIMYKAADDGNVLWIPDQVTAGNANKFDTIKPLVVVCESLGASQTG
jgi:hypothetical protein